MFSFNFCKKVIPIDRYIVLLKKFNAHFGHVR